MGRRYDLVIFDMDGVLTACKSSWQHVHREVGVDNSENFEKFTNGEIDEIEFIRSDVALWIDKNPGIREKDLVRYLRTMPLVDGIQETVACLHYNNMKCVICSGGLQIAAAMISDGYGFDGFVGVELLKNPDGSFTGESIINAKLSDKGIATRRFIEEFGTTRERTVSIGNSCTDVKMFENTGLSIAFNPIDGITEAAADHVVRSGNISDVLSIILEVEDRD